MPDRLDGLVGGSWRSPMIMHELRWPEGYLLVVENGAPLRDLLRAQLELAGVSVEVAQGLLASTSFHLAILDHLPADGVGRRRVLVDAGLSPPLTVVSAHDRAADDVARSQARTGQRAARPREPRERVARSGRPRKRIAAVKSKPAEQSARFAAFGPWRLDLIKRRLRKPDATLVTISTAEFELLLRFIGQPNKPLSRDELAPERSETVWLDRSLDNRVYRLRHKLAQVPGGEDLILTIRNQGYCLASAVSFE